MRILGEGVATRGEVLECWYRPFWPVAVVKDEEGVAGRWEDLESGVRGDGDKWDEERDLDRIGRNSGIGDGRTTPPALNLGRTSSMDGGALLPPSFDLLDLLEHGLEEGLLVTCPPLASTVAPSCIEFMDSLAGSNHLELLDFKSRVSKTDLGVPTIDLQFHESKNPLKYARGIIKRRLCRCMIISW